MQYISEEQVETVLDWDENLLAVEQALLAVSTGRASLPPRTITKIASSGNAMITMPGFLDDSKYGALGCKIFTIFPGNPLKSPPLSKESYYFTLIDTETGFLKAVISALQITHWRTVAASAVATKYLHGKNNNTLAIIGAGTLGRLHAEAFQHLFNFKEVRFWNRTLERAQKLVEDFKQQNVSGNFFVCDSVENCVKNADVIVTATTSEEILVKSIWLKKGVHINAIGVNPELQELDDETYKSSLVYVDSMVFAKQQLARLLNIGANFKAEIGNIISGSSVTPASDVTTVFQSLGNAAEDCAIVRRIYDKLSNTCKRGHCKRHQI